MYLPWLLLGDSAQGGHAHAKVAATLIEAPGCIETPLTVWVIMAAPGSGAVFQQWVGYSDPSAAS